MDDQIAAGGLLAMIAFLSAFIEFGVERIFGQFKELKGWPMIMIPAVAGIILCVGLNVDFLKLVGFEGEYTSWIGQVISGIIVGSGSSAWHKFVPTSTKLPKQ